MSRLQNMTPQKSTSSSFVIAASCFPRLSHLRSSARGRSTVLPGMAMISSSRRRYSESVSPSSELVSSEMTFPNTRPVSKTAQPHTRRNNLCFRVHLALLHRRCDVGSFAGAPVSRMTKIVCSKYRIVPRCFSETPTSSSKKGRPTWDDVTRTMETGKVDLWSSVGRSLTRFLRGHQRVKEDDSCIYET